MSKRGLSLLAAFVFWLAAGPALASSFTIQVGDGETVDMSGLGAYYADVESGITFWWLEQGGAPVDPNNTYTGIADLEITGMSAALKEDPFVTSNISFINPTAATQTYTITVTLPIPAFAYDATIASSVGVTVTDTIGGSVSASSVSPDGIYSGQVNGVTILTLMPHATAVSCVGAGCTTTLADNSALPQLAAGPGVANSIGIQLKFSLTAFDQVAVTSRFEIIQVPEPTTLALLGLALGGLLLARRRAA